VQKQEQREEHDFKFERLNEKREKTYERKVKRDLELDEIGFEAYPVHLKEVAERLLRKLEQDQINEKSAKERAVKNEQHKIMMHKLVLKQMEIEQMQSDQLHREIQADTARKTEVFEARLLKTRAKAY